MKNKKIMIIVLAAILLLTGFIVYKVIDAREEAERIAKMEEEERRKVDAVMSVLTPFAEKYGFDDFVCNEADFPSVGSVHAVVTSEKFGEADDVTKLMFLAEVEFVNEKQRYDTDDRLIHAIAKHGLSLKVISGEYSYYETVF